ncbi:YHYH protein [Halieaceae bacterium IMCC14734]|uniref:YHYH protein n=1 Tax=Candidatus Litorirhabdus singularis TaxID=2518993 RepID=A0ABT3TCU1_9GAMM|nr:YHYH protein [Candidatus Litorirhabdus singularis]MCX2979621.1 YHYH protein [Candidatus Litorirhabdus singularis]
MSFFQNNKNPLRWLTAAALLTLLPACGSGDSGGFFGEPEDPQIAVVSSPTEEDGIDITNAILEATSGDCADYEELYVAEVLDLQTAVSFNAFLELTTTTNNCRFSSNNIPNHFFNDASAAFATQVAVIARDLQITRFPTAAVAPTPLSQQSYDAVMLNGVVLDILSAGCYNPSDAMADQDGNTPIGCSINDPWLLDPMSDLTNFGTDMNNAHTQPDGSYHYHGNPNALFDDSPGPNGSPVIGFAADGFPIFGSYFFDIDSGAVRKAISGYTLIPGARPQTAADPGGNYDGTYIDDYEFTDSGDLDSCNGMTVDGQYGYYVTDTYPWVINCFTGTPDSSFAK